MALLCSALLAGNSSTSGSSATICPSSALRETWVQGQNVAEKGQRMAAPGEITPPGSMTHSPEGPRGSADLISSPLGTRKRAASKGLGHINPP